MKDAEGYFIQMLFCKNLTLLSKKYRGVYDAMYKIYDELFEDGKKNNMDVMEINKKFIGRILKGKEKNK